jgi:hypothetical protein
MRRSRWLGLFLLATACGSGATAIPPSAPSQPAPIEEPPTRGSSPPPPAEEPQDPGSTACFATPVTFGQRGGKDRFGPKPIDAELPTKLAGCPGEPEPIECKYTIARAYFEARHFAEAAPVFRDVARSESNHELAVFAAQLYLESLNVLGSQAEPPRPSCYDAMTADVPVLRASLCGPTPRPADEEFCSTLTRIEMDISRLTAEKIVIRADRGEGDPPSLYHQAGEAYLAAFNRHCAFSRPDKDKKKKPVAPPGWTTAKITGCSEMVFNAMKAFQAAREPDLAEGARRVLLDPLHQLDRTDLAKKVSADKRE